MASQSMQAVANHDPSLLKLKTSRTDLARPAVTSSGTSRSQRSMQPGGVLARLQGLFPPSLSSSQSIPTPTVSPNAVTSPLVSNPEFIKIRIITWNMHDSLPKGNLEELLGSVPLYTPRSIVNDGDRMALPGLSLEETHPYHIIVVGGQECPTLSGIPMGLAANFKHWDLKERDKEKHKDQDLDKDRDRDKSKDKHLLHHTKSLLSKHLKPEHPIYSRMSDHPRNDPAVDDNQVHGPVPTSGWSAVLEDWFANGVGSLHDVKPVITTTVPTPGEPSGGDAHDHIGTHTTATGVPQKPATTTVGFHRSNTLDVNWQSTISGTTPASFSTSDTQGRVGPYELLVKERLMGIYLAIYVHRDVRSLVRGVSTGAVPAGLMGGRLGNKGGVGASVNFRGTTFLFLNAHLAAHEGKVPLRVANLAKIKAELPVESFLSSEDPRIFAEDLTERFDHTWIFGDLNFRLDISRLHADWLISRKEYTQALAFDQLSKLIQDGDPAFAGLREADINFPPTFKYDVSRTAKQREKRGSRHAHQRSKSNLGEVEEKECDLDPGITNYVDVDDDDEMGEAASLRSSTWTSNNSKCRMDATDDGSDHSFSSQTGGDLPLNHTSKLVSHAALKAKAAWMTFLNASREAQMNNFSPRQKKGTSAVKLGVPGSSSFESSHRTKATSNRSASSLGPPMLKRAVSARILLVQPKAVDEVSSAKNDKGVYDSSSKQRVPSWCDRILWKSTVAPTEDLMAETEFEHEAEPTRSRGRSSRVSQLLNQAFRPRSRRNSSQAESNLRILSDQRDITSRFGLDGEPLAASPGLFQSKSLEPLPSTSIQTMAADDHSRPRSVSAIGNNPARVPRRSSMPVFSPPVGLMSSRRADTDQLSVPLPQDNADSTSSTAISTQRTAPKRWFLNFNFKSRDQGPSSPVVNPTPDTEPPPTRTPKRRKGDVVCLSYRTLDDRQMSRLEGRSDHRPVMGSYAIYT